MLLELSPDQEVLREATARFLADRVPADVVRALRTNAAGFEPDYWRDGAELGWTSLLVGEEQGGGSVSGAGLVDLTLVAHEFGLRSAPGPLTSTNVVAATLAEAGGANHPAQASALGELLAGTAVASWCLGGPPPLDRLGSTGVSYRVEGDSLVLRGVARPVEAAGQADHLLVTAHGERGLTQVLVSPGGTGGTGAAGDPGVAGLTIEPLRTVELNRRFATVSFDDVRVGLDQVVGAVGEAADQVERQLQRAIVISGAEAVGAMQAAFELTVRWAFERYSYGRPLASYQALKHRFADLKTWLEAAHAISDAAAAAVDARSPEAAELVSAAKSYIGENGTELLQECVQLHGGIGVTYEHDLHLFLRRGTVSRAMYGTPAEHRQRVAGLVEHRKEQE
ncbi:Acyl-CoA dehydrogenase [Parafrankia irregularis]|uniref:Acyl-CoA dehydrogenase n=1 Tax=Parafrankia irregularis TaxID=795642 RepID=A0A0S4QGJ8_9ACTN|nr:MULTISPECIES: acyl-CoA dehydrogenase family protein [Parafrankia]MBE3200914.1 acyl-CoA/acyl-ACP dehydrogenase [Parafrankia sp. CH37]CUU54688.1 Acyl-CoA dehydrogenase [Parafrankia irregularis]